MQMGAMFDGVAPYFAYWWTGALVTMLLLAVAFPAAVAMGLAASLAGTSRSRFISWLAVSYMSVFRALPEVLVIFVVYFGSNIALRKIQLETGINLPGFSPVIAALVAMSFQFGAYAAVIFTDWIRIFPTGLIEAGAAVGMKPGQIRRRIIIPLLLRQATPALGNLLLVLLKISALASLIGVEELSRRTTIIAGSTRDPLLCYSIAAVMYIAITAVTSASQARIEALIRTRG